MQARRCLETLKQTREFHVLELRLSRVEAATNLASGNDSDHGVLLQNLRLLEQYADAFPTTLLANVACRQDEQTAATISSVSTH